MVAKITGSVKMNGITISGISVPAPIFAEDFVGAAGVLSGPADIPAADSIWAGTTVLTGSGEALLTQDTFSICTISPGALVPAVGNIHYLTEFDYSDLDQTAGAYITFSNGFDIELDILGNSPDQQKLRIAVGDNTPQLVPIPTVTTLTLDFIVTTTGYSITINGTPGTIFTWNATDPNFFNGSTTLDSVYIFGNTTTVDTPLNFINVSVY